MLFLVISTPRPERPSEWAAQRTTFWPWLAAQQKTGLCKWGYARAGRGATALLDVPSHEMLHELLNQWADIIPASFEVLPLIEISASKKFLDQQLKSGGQKR